MIHSKITSTIVTRSFRRSSYRTLNLQRNFSKACSTSQIYTFRYNIKNQSSCFPLSSGLSRKSLLHIPASSNLESQRNFSNILQDIQKLFEPKKEDAAVESTTNALESEEVSLSLSDVIDSVCNSWLIKWLEKYISEVHEVSGLPWWATIAVTAFMFRTSVVLPAAISQLFVMTRIRKVEVDVKKSVPAIKEKIEHDRKKFGWTDEIAKQKLNIAINKKWNGLIYNNNCHPMKKLILPLVQVPLWLSMTLATRNLCIPNPSDVNNQVYSELSTGGFAWITNLTEVDPYMILPVTLALVNLAIIELHQLFKVDPRSKEERKEVLFFRTITLGLIPIAAYMPAAINIYWVSSSLYGLTQAFILHSGTIRYLFELPVPEPEQKYPYRLLKKNIQLRLGMTPSKGTVQWFTGKFNVATMQLIFSLKNDCKTFAPLRL